MNDLVYFTRIFFSWFFGLQVEEVKLGILRTMRMRETRECKRINECL